MLVVRRSSSLRGGGLQAWREGGELRRVAATRRGAHVDCQRRLHPTRYTLTLNRYFSINIHIRISAVVV